MNKPVLLRILLDIVIALCVLNGGWFFAAPLGIAGVFYYPYYVEIMLAGLAYTALFGSVYEMGVRGYAGVIVSIVIFAAIVGLKKALRFRE